MIAYDRLIFDTDALTYYVTFDNYMVGTVQARYIVEALDLEKAGSVPVVMYFHGGGGEGGA